MLQLANLGPAVKRKKTRTKGGAVVRTLAITRYHCSDTIWIEGSVLASDFYLCQCNFFVSITRTVNDLINAKGRLIDGRRLKERGVYSRNLF